jgi:hypothetical protein
MATWVIELLASWAPVMFLLSGMLMAACRAWRKRITGADRQTGIDPDIRVRVTGKIS